MYGKLRRVGTAPSLGAQGPPAGGPPGLARAPGLQRPAAGPPGLSRATPEGGGRGLLAMLGGAPSAAPASPVAPTMGAAPEMRPPMMNPPMPPMGPRGMDEDSLVQRLRNMGPGATF